MSFNEDMDTAVQPPNSFVKFDIDDAQQNAISFDWQTDRMFRVTYSEAALGPTDVDLKTLTTHPLFRTALGALVFPFDVQGFELDITPTFSYIDPDLLICVLFQSDMDETVTPVPADFTIYVDDVPKEPDSMFWDKPRELFILYAEAGLGSPDVDIELLAATDRLRCVLGSVIPAFRINDLGA